MYDKQKLTKRQRARLLAELDKACKSSRPMTAISQVLGMDLSLYETSQEWQDAVTVMIADIRYGGENVR